CSIVDCSGWLSYAQLTVNYKVRQIAHTSTTRATLAQTHLNAKQRQQNLDNAFIVNRTVSVAGKDLALIDDVITTSATLNAIVPLLFRAGARSVEVWAICRTL
uniref:ComF family protein n=1 Tax=Proteus mirabilis TaxID=584 RepID=UPI003CC916C6